jgi:hypothetical protein
VDRFWRVLRIGCISIFAFLTFTVVSCTVIVRLNERSREKARDELWSRGAEILNQSKKRVTVTTVKNLFGPDLDGVCVVEAGPPYVDAMRKASPDKFASAIQTIANKHDVSSTFGKPWEGDVWYSFVYAVRDGVVVKKYELVRKSSLDIYVTERDGNRCFDWNAPIQLNFYPRDKDGEATLIITTPPDKNLKS